MHLCYCCFDVLKSEQFIIHLCVLNRQLFKFVFFNSKLHILACMLYMYMCIIYVSFLCILYSPCNILSFSSFSQMYQVVVCADQRGSQEEILVEALCSGSLLQRWTEFVPNLSFTAEG